MAIKCGHLITNNTKIVKQGIEGRQTNFLCALKRMSKDDSKVINEAYQKQTQVSVAGYTCYYYDNKMVKHSDCPKFEAEK